ncbi:DsbA family protein [Streptomyces sp. NPDC059455]|uniref:DsbA family protein n=1 Tax=Streptomyces sp. NPDC059455 TaxID=3346837 RepID=UPI00369BB48D
MKKHLIIAAVIIAAFAAAIGSFAAFSPQSRTSTINAEPAADAQPVRPSSHRLTQPEKSELTVVEFLDFECEACGAMFPVVERLRQEYGDRVTFVARYFPMPGHRNAEPAAHAAEAAAQQGKFPQMYRKLFTAQKSWGEAQAPKAATFRGHAEQLGLDMKRFGAALQDRRTAERIRIDQRDGLALGVQGTPTFFVGGVKVSTPVSYQEFKTLIENQLAR